MIELRDYQAALESDIYRAWGGGARNVLAVAPTGAGKTVLFSKILADERGASVAIAHRQELVGQISLSLNRYGVRHRIIGSKALIKDCVSAHMVDSGRSYYDPRGRCAAAGVDTLIRMDPADPFFGQVRKFIGDEGHHFLRGNKWGKAATLFPNALGLLVTATPTRADGKGLGAHAEGIADTMVLGPEMRELIRRGYLTDYRIFAPPSDLDLSTVSISAGGDYSPPGLATAVHKSHITGDVVAHYLRLAPGKLGVTFAVDVAAAHEITQAFNEAGVPAALVTAATSVTARAAILREFRARRILQLVNVDLFGEGFDLPAIEVVSMARPTASYPLFAQQFGRALRIMEGKEYALVIDHVGNVLRHGLPDRPRVWTLDRRERRSKWVASDVIPVRSCPQCTGVFERIYRACPYCGHYPEPAERSGPEQVDGDLAELSPEVLAALRGEIARVDGSPLMPRGAAPEVVGAINRRHRERQEAQAALRAAMEQWGGYRVAEGLDLVTRQRLFFHRFGVDVATAQTLGAREAEELRRKVVDGTVNRGL